MLNQKTIIAKDLIDSNRLNEAESILLELNDKFSLFELAKLRRIQGRNKEAEKIYLKSLSVQPEIKYPIESDINIELGRIYVDLGKIDEARNRYMKGVDRISLDKNIYRELGEFYLREKKYKLAEECLEKAVNLFPKDIKSNLSLAMVYRKIGKDEQDKKILNRLLSDKSLKNNKFLYNQVLNEYEIIMRKEYLESKPRLMRITTTNKCNIGCRYCDIWKDSSWDLSEDRMREIIGTFPYLENIEWLGGETFLYKGFEEILEESAKYDNFHQTIYTNGLLLNERILEKISKANISLLIAIDAGKKETYEYLRRGASWDKLCKNLELIKEFGQRTNKKIDTIFNAVISKSNYKEVFDMVEMAHKYDFNKIRFMSILGNSDENIFLKKDFEKIQYLIDAMPLVAAKAREYNIYPEIEKIQLNGYKDINVKFNNKITDLTPSLSNDDVAIHCIFPWTQVVIDSKGPMRMCPSCNEWLSDSTNKSIEDFWNCEGMQFYRKKFGELYTCKAGRLFKFDSAGPNDNAACPTCVPQGKICAMIW